MTPNTKPRVDEKTLSHARSLRQETTFPERLLWSQLRGHRLNGLQFRRQHPLGQFIVDFCCVERRLVVELDGMTHVGTGDYDDARTAALHRMGYRVIRFTNDEVLQSLDAVVEAISHSLSPSGGDGESSSQRGTSR